MKEKKTVKENKGEVITTNEVPVILKAMLSELRKLNGPDIKVSKEGKKETSISTSDDLKEKMKVYTKVYGFKRAEASNIILNAQMTQADPDAVVSILLKQKETKDIGLKKAKLKERGVKLGHVLYKLGYEPKETDTTYEEAWHLYANEMKRELGLTVNWTKKHDKDQEKLGKSNAPTYADYTEKENKNHDYPLDLGLRVMNKLINKYQRRLDRAQEQKDPVVDDIRVD